MGEEAKESWEAYHHRHCRSCRSTLFCLDFFASLKNKRQLQKWPLVLVIMKTAQPLKVVEWREAWVQGTDKGCFARISSSRFRRDGIFPRRFLLVKVCNDLVQFFSSVTYLFRLTKTHKRNGTFLSVTFFTFAPVMALLHRVRFLFHRMNTRRFEKGPKLN